jgi:small subunit ribosomal protein S20
MPNTKSAERRMHSSAKKHAHNKSIKSRLGTLEQNFRALASSKKDQATAALNELCSALDKAAKSGVIHKATANRKKSRLALQLNRARA